MVFAFSHLVDFQGEISYAGYDPSAFFSSIHFQYKRPLDLFKALKDGSADVAALPSCFWESRLMDNPELANAVKPAAIVSEQPCFVQLVPIPTGCFPLQEGQILHSLSAL